MTNGGRIAQALQLAWRREPPPLTLPAEELREIAPLLLRTGAGALGWWRIRERAELQSEPAASGLRDAYRLYTLHALVHEQQIRTVVARLRAAGVEALLAKGWAIARLYPEAALRPYGDVDLYVRPDGYARARALLATGALAAPVDLHRGMAELDDRDAFARAQTATLGDVEVGVPGAEDHLRLLCLHMLRHGAARPLWLCDIALALERRPRDFDWDYFLGGRPRRSRAVACALGLAARLLGARLDDTPLADAAQRLPRWLVPAVLRQWGAATVRREPLATFLRGAPGFWAELRRHWPNPIEGTIGVGGPFNELPRLPFQLAHTLLRAARFPASLARRRRAGRS